MELRFQLAHSPRLQVRLLHGRVKLGQRQFANAPAALAEHGILQFAHGDVGRFEIAHQGRLRGILGGHVGGLFHLQPMAGVKAQDGAAVFRVINQLTGLGGDRLTAFFGLVVIQEDALEGVVAPRQLVEDEGARSRLHEHALFGQIEHIHVCQRVYGGAVGV
jgi:hypothetical protein